MPVTMANLDQHIENEAGVSQMQGTTFMTEAKMLNSV